MLMFDKQSELTIKNRHILGLIEEDLRRSPLQVFHHSVSRIRRIAF